MTRHDNATLRRSSFPPARLASNHERNGRTRTSETPLRIKTFGLSADEHSRDYIRDRAGFKLGKFAMCIQAMEIRLKDESGPHGEPLVSCTLTIMLNKAGIVVVDRAAHEARMAFDLAADVAERSVRRTLQRQRDLKRQHADPGQIEED